MDPVAPWTGAMPKMINLMVACAENRVMGRRNRLPWRIPEDLRLFHEETAGKTIVLGRICYQTWPRARDDGEGDRHFPEWRHLEWREVSRRDSSDENFRYTFFVLER